MEAPSFSVNLAGLYVALRQLRRERGLTQRELSAHLRLASHTSIVDYEAGRRIPPADVVARYERHFGLAAGSLTSLRERELARAAANEAEARRGPRPAMGASGPIGTPRQLPSPVATFTGRGRQLAELDQLLAHHRAPGARGLPLAAVTGPPGIGKTALAVTWAHQAAGRFQDGQLYADLAGFAAGPRIPAKHTLAAFLRALGVPPSTVPTDTVEAAALYRSLLSDRRVLIVLDNAADEAQIRPLLPGSASCMVAVTSRNRLPGLAAVDGAWELPLGPLEPDDAEALLDSLLRRAPARIEPEARRRLARDCGHWPLALRIAAAGLALLRTDEASVYLEELGGSRRLGALELGTDPRCAVRAAFATSYRALDAAARRAFRLLGLAPGPDFDVFAAAALTGTTLGEAAGHLRTLERAHLIEQPRTGRYILHELLREYARERAAAEDGQEERERSIAGLADYYALAADRAGRRLYPQMLRLTVPAEVTPVSAAVPLPRLEPDEALAWFDEELPSLVATAEYAAQHGPARAGWLIPDALRGYLWRRRPPVAWKRAAAAARTAADRHGSATARAAAHLLAADGHAVLGERDRAVAEYVAADRHAAAADWQPGRATALGNLGGVLHAQGRLTEAIDRFREAVRISEACGFVGGRATMLNNLGRAHADIGQLEQAAACHSAALAIHRGLNSPSGIAAALNNLAVIHHRLGDLETAAREFEDTLEHYRRVGDDSGTAAAHTNLATVHCEAGRPEQATEHASAALALAREAREPAALGAALIAVARVLSTEKRHIQARQHFQSVLDLAPQCGEHNRIEALIGHALTDLALGLLEQARADAQSAFEAARVGGIRMLEERARDALREIASAAG